MQPLHLLAFALVVAPAASQDKLSVNLFAMSKCPDMVDVFKAFTQAMDLYQLDDFVDFHTDFIAMLLPNGTIHAMHGPDEVAGNQLQLCAQADYTRKQSSQFFRCMIAHLKEIPHPANNCTPAAGINMLNLLDCNSNRGEDLMKTSLQRAKEANATHSPTLLIGDDFRCVEEKCPADQVLLLQQVCTALKKRDANKLPAACTNQTLMQYVPKIKKKKKRSGCALRSPGAPIPTNCGGGQPEKAAANTLMPESPAVVAVGVPPPTSTLHHLAEVGN